MKTKNSKPMIAIIIVIVIVFVISAFAFAMTRSSRVFDALCNNKYQFVSNILSVTVEYKDENENYPTIAITLDEKQYEYELCPIGGGTPIGQKLEAYNAERQDLKGSVVYSTMIFTKWIELEFDPYENSELEKLDGIKITLTKID